MSLFYRYELIRITSTKYFCFWLVLLFYKPVSFKQYFSLGNLIKIWEFKWLTVEKPLIAWVKDEHLGLHKRSLILACEKGSYYKSDTLVINDEKPLLFLITHLNRILPSYCPKGFSFLVDLFAKKKLIASLDINWEQFKSSSIINND